MNDNTNSMAHSFYDRVINKLQINTDIAVLTSS
jgi:hypothetical protein